MPDLEDIRAKITPRTKGIVVINPNNPTGALYSKQLLQSIVALAREHGLVIFADEVYDKVLYDDVVHTPLASLSTDVLTLTFNSLSKAYRSCGYRAGWMVVSGDKKAARDYIEGRSEEHTSELQSPCNLVCRLLLEKKKNINIYLSLLIEHSCSE